MNFLNFKFLFLTFPAEAPILLREVQWNSLKGFRGLPWCGSLGSIFYPHSTATSHFWHFTETFLVTPLAKHT